MALTDAEIEWINWVAGKDITPQARTAELDRSIARDAFLANTLGAQLSDVSGEIDAAQKKIVRREQVDPGFMKAVYKKISGDSSPEYSEMKWRADDADTNQGILERYQLRADVEIDSVADRMGKTVDSIPSEDLMPLVQSFERIKQMEKAMKMQLDDNGDPLFSEADIRNELWTPLVRQGLIPDNMVPDEYSEHALNFAGAQSFYEDKIEAYTATHTKAQENWTKGLRIAKDVATLGTALTSGAITMANAPQVADNKAEIDAKKTELEGLDAQSDKARELQSRIDTLETTNKQLEAMSTYADTGSAVLLGGISGLEMAVDHHYSTEPDTLKKWMQTIEKGVAVAQSVSVAAVNQGMSAQGASDGMITCVTSGLTAAFKAAGFGPSLVLTIKEQDPNKQAAMITGLIGDFAGIVASSINAVGGKVATLTAEEQDLPQADQDRIEKERAATQAAMSQIAAAIKIGIVTAGSAPQIIRAYKAGDTRALGLLLGGAAISTIFAASSEAIFDGMRRDSTGDEIDAASPLVGQFMEEDGDETGHDSGSAKIMDSLSGQLTAFDATVFDGLKPDLLKGVEADEMADAIDGDVKAAQKKQAEEELAKVFSPEGIEAIMADVDAELVGFEQMYSDAMPDPDINTRTPEEIVQATAAIDRAMANTAALRQKVALINGITGGAAGVIAALVPGAGAVVAAQKVAADIYALIKCVETHNAWVDSMELALAGQSGSAAGIQNTLKNARIHLSQASVKLVLDSVKAGSEVARAFDPTGVATATSAGVSMAAAVVEFGYKMQKEADIVRGWNAYKAALAEPGNRKAARKALRMNSTLAKCSIAYGASIMGDPVAKQAVRATGLSVAALQNDNDICVKLIAYLENELADDPTVLRVDNKDKGDWHPGTPAFTLVSWTSFKAAAHRAARPPMSADGLSSPGIDRLFGVLGKFDAWPDADIAGLVSDAARLRDHALDRMTADEAAAFAPEADEIRRRVTARALALAEVLSCLDRLLAAFQAYAPTADTTGAPPHDGMARIAATFATLAWAERVTVEARITDLTLPD